MPPTHHLDIPALPVLLPLGLGLMVLSWAVLRRRGSPPTAWRLGAMWACGWYGVAVLGATFLPLHLAWGPGAGPVEMFRIILVPLSTMREGDFVLNIVMTLPLAAVLAVLFGIRDRRRVVLAGFLLSLSIEVSQGILLVTLHCTRWADVNDLISNTLGAYLGWVLLERLMRSPAVRRAAARVAPALVYRPAATRS
jgi:glycopeptide antibiotics resistance protein